MKRNKFLIGAVIAALIIIGIIFTGKRVNKTESHIVIDTTTVSVSERLPITE